MGVAKTLTAISTAVVVMLSLVILGTGIWMTTKAGATECVQYLRIPLIVIGSVMCAVALAGFIGAVNDIAWLLFIYLAVVFLAIWALLAVTVFAFLITNQAAGAAASNKGVGSWKTTDFSNWLQNQVSEQSKWGPIQTCLAAGSTCSVLSQTNTSTSTILTSIQAGCCYPPQSCTPPATPIADCLLYSSDPALLCYRCDSCKGSFLKTMSDQWRMVAYICLGVTLLLLVVYIVGCCTYRSAKRKDGFFGKV